MASTEQNPASSGRPARNSAALVVIAFILLGALVWALNPRRPPLHPAPLKTLPVACAPAHGDFVPSDVTEVPGLKLDGLPAAMKNRILYRLNMEPCPCGCGESVAACRVTERTCDVSAKLADSILKEEIGQSHAETAGTR